MNASTALPERDEEQERVIGIVFDVPPQQATIIYCLSKGAVVSTQELHEYLGTKTPPKVAVFHAREALRAKGMDIKSKWGVGYWMDEDTRTGIELRVRGFLEG